MGEKVLWGRINGLIGKRGYCFATNDWLSKQLGYSPRTIEDYIRKLVGKGYLQREYGHRGKQDRRLYPIPEIAGLLPWNSRVASLKEQGSSIGVSRKISNRKNLTSDKPRRETVKKEDLDHLTNGYAARKGIQPQGDEWKPIQQAYRRMLLDGNTVEQIEGCEDAIVNEGWTWTINTVRRWMPDFRAGKFPSKDGRDADRIRALRDDIGEIDRYVESQLDPRLIELERRDVDVGDLTVEQCEEVARLHQLRQAKMAERARLVQELGK